MITDGFKVRNYFKQGERLALSFFNSALEYVIGQLSVQVMSTIFYKLQYA